jgi:hypothetical protein
MSLFKIPLVNPRHVRPCHHDMARSRVTDGGQPPGMEESCEYNWISSRGQPKIGAATT